MGKGYFASNTVNYAKPADKKLGNCVSGLNSIHGVTVAWGGLWREIVIFNIN
jgi:hypothetical protein